MHVNIIILHVDLDIVHADIIFFMHLVIIFLARRGQKKYIRVAFERSSCTY